MIFSHPRSSQSRRRYEPQLSRPTEVASDDPTSPGSSFAAQRAKYLLSPCPPKCSCRAQVLWDVPYWSAMLHRAPRELLFPPECLPNRLEPKKPWPLSRENRYSLEAGRSLLHHD